MADSQRPESNENDNDSDDEYFESPAEIIREFGTHPLMERGQKALLATLKETHDKLQVEFLEKEEEQKRITLQREELGVMLYNLQQQLAPTNVHKTLTSCGKLRVHMYIHNILVRIMGCRTFH
jgi:hypothetical protein